MLTSPIVPVEVEMLQLIKQVPAFTDPICQFYSPQKSITDPEIIARMAYNQVGQNVLKGLSSNSPPYLYWTGPFKTDLGQTATEFSGTRKADFWFWFNAITLTDAMIWGYSVQQSLAGIFPGIVSLSTWRLTSAIHIDRHPVPNNQTNLTGQEFAMNQCALGYTFGYQIKGP